MSIPGRPQGKTVCMASLPMAFAVLHRVALVEEVVAEVVLVVERAAAWVPCVTTHQLAVTMVSKALA
eukprot:COSAG02_NODE_27763_length_603_cov_0.797619_2_plen_67_part_00